MGIICIISLRKSASYSSAKIVSSEENAPGASWILIVQTIIALCTVVLVNSTQSFLSAKEPLPFVNQILGWVLFLGSLIFAFAYGIRHTPTSLSRNGLIFLGFAPSMIILSLSYETMFYASYAVTLYLWLLIEVRLYSQETDSIVTDFHKSYSSAKSSKKNSGVSQLYRSLRLADIRIALLFLFFINTAFFGTGNVASRNN